PFQDFSGRESAYSDHPDELEDVEELDMADLVDDGSLASAVLAPDAANGRSADDRASAVPFQIAHENGEVEFDPRELGADADDDGSFDVAEPMRLGNELVPIASFPKRAGSEAGGPPVAAATDPDAHHHPELSEGFEFEADRTAVISPFPLLHDVQAPRSDARAVAPSPAPEPDGQSAGPAPVTIAGAEPSAPVADLDLGLDQLASLAAEEQSDVREFRRHQLRVAELEREVERLRSELEEALRAPPAGGSPFSREREFLNLREVINKKEKLILDLNDQVDARDRQILSEKERLRELDRVRSDLDAKTLELEQSLLGANEELAGLRTERRSLTDQLRRQTEALASVRADAEELSRLLERERAQWREERDALQRKHAAALDGQKQQLEAARTTAEAALREQYGADLRTLKEAYEETTAEKDRSFGASLALAEVRRQEELTAAQRGAEEKLRLELNEQHRRHQEEVEALRQEQATEVETLVRQNQEARQALEDRHSAHIARVEEDQSQALAAADRRRASEVSDADKRRVMELAELEERRRRDLLAAAEERAQAEAELEEKFEGAQAAMQREHAEERRELEARGAGLERDLRDRVAELSQARDSLRAREETIVSLHKLMGERDERLADQRAAIEELERQNAGYQEQVLRAFQKIKADEAIVARAKKAMAIALTLLDDADQSAAAPSDE
ncbi:MAG TPA: hypothetical protein VEL05_07330, partial [Candidatus Acidoferrum sp.]|nr:hypothetical protein [Candidatus Acidoferrum sp.]